MSEFLKFIISGAVGVLVFIATASFYFGGEWTIWEQIKIKHETKQLEEEIAELRAEISKYRKELEAVRISIPTRVVYSGRENPSAAGAATSCPNPDEVVTGTAGLSITRGEIRLNCRPLKLE